MGKRMISPQTAILLTVHHLLLRLHTIHASLSHFPGAHEQLKGLRKTPNFNLHRNELRFLPACDVDNSADVSCAVTGLAAPCRTTPNDFIEQISEKSQD